MWKLLYIYFCFGKYSHILTAYFFPNICDCYDYYNFIHIHVLCIYVHTRTFHILFRLFIYLNLAAPFNVQFNLYANALFRKNKVSSKLSGVLSIEATVTQMQITLTRKKTWRIERARERERKYHGSRTYIGMKNKNFWILNCCVLALFISVFLSHSLLLLSIGQPFVFLRVNKNQSECLLCNHSLAVQNCLSGW